MKYLIGLGNYLMFDDSIGIRLIEEIAGTAREEGFRALDMSGNALNILSYLNDDTEKIVIVDTARMGGAAGSCRFFALEDVETVKPIAGITTHEDDMVQVLRFAEKNGYPIPEVVFMGIEPESVLMDYGLSKTLRDRFDEYLDLALGEVAR